MSVISNDFFFFLDHLTSSIDHLSISYSLWGEHGQALLEGAQLCLINVSALGTEILKNIVLPGIGGFTIVDSGIVTEEDVGCK